MANKLKQYFPMIWERKELLHLIESDTKKFEVFHDWNEEQQTEFLDMCCGVRGIRILYDSFFKEVMNPEYAPERLNSFLSLLLGRKVKIRSVLPNDSTRITDETSLLITDIVVELENGSLANVEVQKIGYLFPGARSACYSADLLLRQYRRVRSREKKKFSYKNIKSVYTIVLFEQSPEEFHAYPQNYRHIFSQRSDTGLELELLQKYIFIPLDIFRKILHNKGIANELEAWLAFLCEDDPEMILQLIENWPEFKPMYVELYNMCQNIQGVMDMFSKELQELDRNTVQYMIDIMQETIEKQKKELEDQKKELEDQKKELEEIIQKKQKTEQDIRQAEQDKQQAERDKQQAEQDKQQAERDKQQAERDKQQAEQEVQKAFQRIAELEAMLKEKLNV